MQSKDIYQQFRSISTEVPKNKGLIVISIPKAYHKLSVSVEGYPKFFVRTNEAISAAPTTTLDILSVEYNRLCTLIDDENNSSTNHYTIITLHSLDSSLQEDFIDIMILVLRRLNSIPEKRDIAIEVENLISIFSAMSCPPRKKIQGLWTELLVIERSYIPETLIDAWHNSPMAKYDFTMGRDKIEVKSTASETRLHRFSLEQLRPSTNSRVLIASAIVRQSGPGNGGLSVKDLYTKICSRITLADAQMHVYKVIVETIGVDIRQLNEIYFDYVEASDTLRFYDANDVPGVDKKGVQPGVTSVGFISDLSNVIDIQSEGSTFLREGSLLYESLYE